VYASRSLRYSENNASTTLLTNLLVVLQINAVRDELKSHIQSLPDLTQLPDVSSGGLAPLPSAGDLFTMK
jgi:hypothetical protein